MVLNADYLHINRVRAYSYCMSVIFHVMVFLFSTILVTSSFLEGEKHAVASKENEHVIIEVIPDFLVTKNINKMAMSPEAKSKEISEDPENSKSTELIQKYSQEAHIESAVAEGPEPKRYEQTLAKHIADAIPDLPDNLKNLSVIQLWLKIDMEGNILDYGYRSESEVADLRDIVAKTIRNANPVPKPEALDSVGKVSQYIIPIYFNR